jgi:hypothetical protein
MILRLTTECDVAQKQRHEAIEMWTNIQNECDRQRSVFDDLAIHLKDMALAIDSVAPEAKGD